MANIEQPPVKKTDLLQLFAKFEKQPNDRKVGLEQEAFLVRKADGMPADFAGKNGISALLLSFIADTEFQAIFENPEPILDAGNIIGIASGGPNVSLEPGGAVEISGAPHLKLSVAEAEVAGFNKVLDRLAIKMGLEVLRFGFHPTAKREDIHMVPKSRYGIMRPLVESTGNRGADMMLRTTTVQANMDYSSEAEMVRFFRLGLRLSPIIYYLFQNGDRVEGHKNPHFNERGLAWLDTDPDRCGYPSVVFEPDFGYEKWVDWVCQVPAYFVRRGGYRKIYPTTFATLMEEGWEGARATIQDFEDHLSTIFTEVRLKPQLEMRSADGGDVAQAMGIGAFWKGLLYNSNSLKTAEDLVGEQESEDLLHLQKEVSLYGGEVKYGDSFVGQMARDILAIARDGLDDGDKHYLDFLSEKTANP